MAAPSLRVVDLFAGAGGLSEGFARAGGFETVAAVEHNKFAAATYRENQPGSELFVGDIAGWVRGSLPSADLVVGGPPCQGFSNLGARRVSDPRNGLWSRYVAALAKIRPAYFVMENVANFLASSQFTSLRRETYKNGRLRNYRLEYGVLNSADFGVPQVRKRAVVIGSLKDLHAPGLPIGPLENQPDRWTTVQQAIGELDRTVRQIDLPDCFAEVDGETVPGPFKTLELHLTRRPTQTSLERYRAIPKGGNRHDIPEHLLPPCWRDHPGGSGDVMGRLHWDKPSVTIRTEFWKPEKGRYLHPSANRPITHLEAARLQGFPDDYLWYGSKQEIGRQIGNAVPIGLATGIARHISSQLA